MAAQLKRQIGCEDDVLPAEYVPPPGAFIDAHGSSQYYLGAFGDICPTLLAARSNPLGEVTGWATSMKQAL